MTFYSVLQLLAVVFNPAFMGNYAVTVMAVMIAFSKYRMALNWLPVAMTFIGFSSVNYYEFEQQIAQRNLTDALTLSVKYNFHPVYIEMMESFNNFWLYDYAHAINCIIPVAQIAAVLSMTAYIINNAPYNSWLLKRRRWDRFVSTYLNGTTVYNIIISAEFLCTAFYVIVFMDGVYNQYSCKLVQWNLIPINLAIGFASRILAIDWITYHRGVMIERYLSCADETL